MPQQTPPHQYNTDNQIRDLVAQSIQISYGKVFEVVPEGLVDRRPDEGCVKVAVFFKFPYHPIDPIQCAQCGGIIAPPLRYLRLGRYPACSPECAGPILPPPAEEPPTPCP